MISSRKASRFLNLTLLTGSCLESTRASGEAARQVFFLGPPFQIPPWWIAFSRWLIFLALACNSKVSLLADYFIPASPFARFPLNLERICKRCFFPGGGGVGAVFFSKLLLRNAFSDKKSFQIIGSFEWALTYGLRQECMERKWNTTWKLY